MKIGKCFLKIKICNFELSNFIFLYNSKCRMEIHLKFLKFLSNYNLEISHNLHTKVPVLYYTLNLFPHIFHFCLAYKPKFFKFLSQFYSKLYPKSHLSHHTQHRHKIFEPSQRHGRIGRRDARNPQKDWRARQLFNLREVYDRRERIPRLFQQQRQRVGTNRAEMRRLLD